METARLIFQWINLVASVAIVVIAVRMARRYPDTRSLLAFPILWAAGGAVYYGWVLTGGLSPDAVLLWGAAHRTMAIIMVFGGVCAFWAIVATPATLPDGDDDAE